VWVFIGVVSAINIVALPEKIHDLNHSILELESDPRVPAEFVKGFERIRRDRMRTLVVAAILAPMSLLFAYWKWTDRWWEVPRFSLKAMLLLMSIVALMLGIIVWSIRY
jgi:hypothetical protein